MSYVRTLSAQISLNGSYQSHLKLFSTPNGSISVQPGAISPFLSYVEGVHRYASAWPWSQTPVHGLTSRFGLGCASSLWTCLVITGSDCNPDLQVSFLV